MLLPCFTNKDGFAAHRINLNNSLDGHHGIPNNLTVHPYAGLHDLPDGLIPTFDTAPSERDDRGSLNLQGDEIGVTARCFPENRIDPSSHHSDPDAFGRPKGVWVSDKPTNMKSNQTHHSLGWFKFLIQWR